MAFSKQAVETACVGAKRPASGDPAMDAAASAAAASPVLHPPRARARTGSISLPSEDESAWATLPLVAMEMLFSYALIDLTVQIDPIPMMHHRAVSRRVDDALSLRKWSAVCRGWREAIEQLIEQFQDGTVSLEFVLKSPSELAHKLATTMTQQRHMVMDLRVGIYRHIDQPLKPTLTPIDWKVLLSGLTNLQRLDLSKMNCITCEEMCDVLEAASTRCLKLRALVLPLPHGWMRPPCLTYERRLSPGLYKAYKPLLAALGSALEKWHHAGGASGSTLEHLVFPCMGDHADQFISLVAKFVPQIQVLDAWKLAYFSDGWDDVRCDEHWHITKETWATFTKTCTQLREFNLGLVPPSEAFMAPFTATKKWMLKELTINYSKCSSPKFSVMTELQARLRRSLGEHVIPPSAISSLNLSNLVQVLPRLEILRVNLPSEGEKNLSAFDDDFLVTLAKACPNLKKLFIAGGRGYSSAQSLTKITARGLAALGELAKLEEVALRPLKTLSEDGVAKLLGRGRHGSHMMDVKLMLPVEVSPHVFEPIIASVAALVAAADHKVSPFAVQLAVQECKQRPRYNPDLILNSSQSTPLCQLLESLGELRHRLLSSKSRLRFQAFVDHHTHKLTQINLFTTDWKLRDAVDTLFLRNEIVYDDGNRDAFEWIVTN